MPSENLDRLSALIRQFRVQAKVHPVGATFTPDQPFPNLFIIRNGRLCFSSEKDVGFNKDVNAPALAYFPHGAPPDIHLEVDTQDAQYVCASIYTGGEENPIAQTLPNLVTVPLDKAQSLQAVTEILLEEALVPRCGGGAVVDRLCEVIIIRLMRYLILEGYVRMGLMAGLAHPNLRHAIVAIHENPEKKWSIEALADTAGMSRTHFSNTFKTIVGVTPGEYLSSWRLTLARIELDKGTSLKAVVRKVGFSGSASLSRAFTRRYGYSPRQAQGQTGTISSRLSIS